MIRLIDPVTFVVPGTAGARAPVVVEKFVAELWRAPAQFHHCPYANINIPNYNFYHSPTPTNAGGVAMYTSSRFVVQNVYTQFLKTDMCEAVA